MVHYAERRLEKSAHPITACFMFFSKNLQFVFVLEQQRIVYVGNSMASQVFDLYCAKFNMQSCQENLTKFSVDESQKLFSCGWSKDKILGRRPNHSVNLSRTNNIFPLPSVFSRIFLSNETQKATFSKQQYKFNGIVLHDFFFLQLWRGERKMIQG